MNKKSLRLAIQFLVALIVGLSTLISSFSHAASRGGGGMGGQFRAAGVSIPKRLAGMGYSNIGDINISSLHAGILHFPEVRTENEDSVGARNGNGRSTCHWEITASGRSITCAPFWWQRLHEERPIMALHEYLGALGYSDENYLVSTGMWFLSEAQLTRGLSAQELQPFVQLVATHAKIRYAGGVIGVGGGGQMASVMYRMGTVRRAMALLPTARTAADRKAILDAALILLTTGEDVTYTRGANPSVEFQMQDE